MRLPLSALAVLGLAACGGSSAEVSGSAGGIGFDRTPYVFFGGPYIVISMEEIECIDLSFVNRSYEEGVSPTTFDLALLQFASNSDTDGFEAQRYSIDVDASFSSTVVRVLDGAPTYTRASGGLLIVDEVTDDDATGSFESVVFEDGTLSGTFTAEWCRNLRD